LKEKKQTGSPSHAKKVPKHRQSQSFCLRVRLVVLAVATAPQEGSDRSGAVCASCLYGCLSMAVYGCLSVFSPFLFNWHNDYPHIQ
jgi:hypothetical protein